MAEIPKDMKKLLFGHGVGWHARISMTMNWLGLVCLILGIIAGSINNALGLGAGNWLLLAIALWLWALAAWFTAYFGAKEG